MTDIATGRSKASVQIPLGLIDAGMKIGAHFAPEVEGVDMSNVMEAVRSGMTGKIIDVTDVSGLAWIEIDFPNDITRAARDVLPKLASMPGLRP